MKKLLFAFLATGLVQLTNFASGIILARMLEPAARGEVAQIIAWFSFFTSILLLGINDSITFHRSRNETEGSGAMSAALLLSVPLIAMSVLCCLGVIFAVFPRMSTPSLSAAWLFLLFPPLWQWQQIFYSYFQAGSNAFIWTSLRVVPGVVYIAGLLLIIQLGIACPLTFVAANLVGLALVLSISLGIVLWSGTRLHWPPQGMIRRVFSFGLPLVSQRVALACRDTLDRIVLPFFVISSALGHYVVASSVAYLIYVAGMTVDLVGFPAMARAPNDEARRRIAEFLISVTVCGLVVLVALLTLIREPVVLLLFGPDYAASVDLVPWFLVAGAAQAIRIVIGGAYKAFDRGRSMARFELAGTIVMAMILVGATTQFGTLAGAFAHLASALVSLGMAFYGCVTVLKLSPRHVFLPRKSELISVFKDFGVAFRRMREG